ncbi:ankyrin, partial [Delitschia confertaspora ATCC 74209]
DANCNNSEGYTPLLRALCGGRERIVRTLLETGDVDVDCIVDARNRTPLVVATTRRYDAVTQALLEHGASVHIEEDATDETVLHRASAADIQNIVRALLKNGAQFVARDSKNDTPLLQASSGQEAGIIRLLVECGADPTGRPQIGQRKP